MKVQPDGLEAYMKHRLAFISSFFIFSSLFSFFAWNCLACFLLFFISEYIYFFLPHIFAWNVECLFFKGIFFPHGDIFLACWIIILDLETALHGRCNMAWIWIPRCFFSFFFLMGEVTTLDWGAVLLHIFVLLCGLPSDSLCAALRTFIYLFLFSVALRMSVIEVCEVCVNVIAWGCVSVSVCVNVHPFNNECICACVSASVHACMYVDSFKNVDNRLMLTDVISACVCDKTCHIWLRHLGVTV